MHAVSFLKFKLVSFLFSQINLGINDFQMLMMVVNDNLLEGEHGKLDVSNNSLSAPGGWDTPLHGLYGHSPLDRVWFLTSLS